MPTSKNLALILLIFGLILIPFNYQHFSKDYNIFSFEVIELFKEFIRHFEAFTQQFYNKYLTDYNASFEENAEMLYSLIFVFKKYFINYISIFFIALATAIAKRGTLKDKLLAPLSYTLYFYIFYFILKFAPILSF
jgi:hypothetical protein